MMMMDDDCRGDECDHKTKKKKSIAELKIIRIIIKVHYGQNTGDEAMIFLQKKKKKKKKRGHLIGTKTKQNDSFLDDLNLMID